MGIRHWLVLLTCLLGLGFVQPGDAVAQNQSEPDATEVDANYLERLAFQVVELSQQGRYEEAIPIMEELLALGIAILGNTHPSVATYQNTLATLYLNQGNYEQALPLYEQALDIQETALGLEHPDIATTLYNLATLYFYQGSYARALPLYEQALDIQETTLGTEHFDVAVSLNSLAFLHATQGNYAEAFIRYKRSLKILKANVGNNHPYVASGLNNLADLYRDQGNYAEALKLYEEALDINENVLPPGHPDIAVNLNSLAILYQAQGNYAEALSLHESALSIREKMLGLEHPDVAISLNNLAFLHQAQGNYSEALPLYKQALMIREIALGPEHPDVAQTLNNLALVYQNQGNYDEALTYYKQSLTIFETALGNNHPYVASGLNNLAFLYQAQGNYAKALALYRRALAIRETAFNPEHPEIAQSLNNLALLHTAQSDYEQAITYLQSATQVEESNLSSVLTYASEAESKFYLNTFNGTTNVLISLSFQSETSTSMELSINTVLRRKGRVLDSVTNSFQQLRQQLSAEEKGLLDDLNANRTALTTLYFKGMGNYSPEQYQAEINRLKENIESIETTLSQHSSEFRVETQPISIERVQALIPNNAILVELVRYVPFNFANLQNRWTAPERYAAYILTTDGQPQAIDLGEAASINALVADFRRALGSQSIRTKTIARQLDEMVMAPIRPLLGDSNHLLISPDSQLNLIPFAALVTEDDRYLIEDYQLTYLTSGRDLLRLQLDQPSQQGPVILANPDYENPGSEEVVQIAQIEQGENRGSRRSVDITDLAFGPLPGTGEEAETIAPLLDNATVLTQANATENTLKQLNAPNILHIATHGFFLEDVEFFVPPSSRSFGAGIEIVSTDDAPPIQPTPSNTENPLLRSGLALAGFNQRSSGTEDGVLTALEASGLNLYGTKLVVLSACDTGIGQVSTGEGVYGLRRAFVTAGAESQLMSLWQVSDFGTSALMRLYYQNLKAGQGRSEALHNAQLALLESGQYQHPYYWASFIFSGDWSPLEGI